MKTIFYTQPWKGSTHVTSLDGPFLYANLECSAIRKEMKEPCSWNEVNTDVSFYFQTFYTLEILQLGIRVTLMSFYWKVTNTYECLIRTLSAVLPQVLREYTRLRQPNAGIVPWHRPRPSFLPNFYLLTIRVYFIQRCVTSTAVNSVF